MSALADMLSSRVSGRLRSDPVIEPPIAAVKPPFMLDRKRVAEKGMHPRLTRLHFVGLPSVTVRPRQFHETAP
jgi:hypothetical protein